MVLCMKVWFICVMRFFFCVGYLCWLCKDYWNGLFFEVFYGRVVKVDICIRWGVFWKICFCRRICGGDWSFLCLCGDVLGL